jgi:hypothetical protein
MPKPPQSLEGLQVASPCTASWEDMAGTERVRYCRQCRLRVYNLSAMSRTDAEQFIHQREGRTCVRFYRRADGTMLTDDCPVGLRAMRGTARRSWAALIAGLASVLALFAGGAIYSTGERPRDRTLRRLEPFASVWEWLDPSQPQAPDPTPPPPPQRECIMGKLELRQ